MLRNDAAQARGPREGIRQAAAQRKQEAPGDDPADADVRPDPTHESFDPLPDSASASRCLAPTRTTTTILSPSGMSAGAGAPS
jgi:hypothetical protein